MTTTTRAVYVEPEYQQSNQNSVSEHPPVPENRIFVRWDFVFQISRIADI